MIVQHSKDGGRERHVLTACVVSRTVLARVAARWDGRLFSSDWSNLIAGWCVDHFKKHSTAPGKDVIHYFQEWSDKSKDEATVRTVEAFLGHLSDHYSKLKEEVNATLVLEQADKLFNRVRARRLVESIEADLDDGNDDKALKRVTEFSKVEMSEQSGVDLFQDPEVWRQAFDEDIDAEPVVRFRGALGKFYGKSLRKGNFLSYIAKNKAGKSFFLIDLAWRAMENRKRVAFFAVGDMTRGQMIERFAARLLCRPVDGGKAYHWPKHIESPSGPEGDPAVDRVEKETKDRLTVADCLNKMKWYQKHILRSNRSFFKLACYENYSVNVLGVKSTIEEWIDNGFVPDCIAEGSKVLTERGLVNIESVVESDRLWDGSSWVSHGGLVYKGERDVITYCGLKATPDHLVWTGRWGWRTLIDCKRLGLPVAQTGFEGQEVRIGENYVRESPGQRVQLHKKWEGLHRSEVLCSSSVCAMCGRKMDSFGQPHNGEGAGMSPLRPTKKISEVVLESNGIREAALYQQKPSGVEELWWKGNQVPVHQYVRRLSMGHGQLRITSEAFGTRQGGQRRALRTGKHPIFHQEAELLPYQEESYSSENAQIQIAISGGEIQRRLSREAFIQKNPTGGAGNVEFRTEKVRVYDLLNAGPFHRFTVQGLLAHNCVVIDYADLLAPVDGKVDTREQINTTWKYLRSISQKYHVLLVTATQADANSFKSGLLSRVNFSEDRRKLDHVTGMIGINQKPSEEEQEVVRLNWVNRREEKAPERKVVYVAGSRDCCNPCVVSCF